MLSALLSDPERGELPDLVSCRIRGAIFAEAIAEAVRVERLTSGGGGIANLRESSSVWDLEASERRGALRDEDEEEVVESCFSYGFEMNL